MNIKFLMLEQLKEMFKANTELSFGEVLYTALRPKNSKITKDIKEITLKDIRGMKNEHIYTCFENALIEVKDREEY